MARIVYFNWIEKWLTIVINVKDDSFKFEWIRTSSNSEQRQKTISSYCTILSHLTLMFILKVIKTIATFSFASSLKVSQEVIIGSITSSHLLNGDELLILDEEDTVTVAETEDLVWIATRMEHLRLVLLDLLKDILTVISNCYSWRHDWKWMIWNPLEVIIQLCKMFHKLQAGQITF